MTTPSSVTEFEDVIVEVVGHPAREEGAPGLYGEGKARAPNPDGLERFR